MVVPHINSVCNNSAVDFLSRGDGTFLSIWATWQSVVVTAVLVVFLVSALVYIIAGLIAHRGLRVWAQNQIYEGFATLVIAFFIVGIVSWICSVDVSLVGADCVPNDAGYNLARFAGMYSQEPGACDSFSVAVYYLEDFNIEISKGWWAVAIVNMIISAIANTTMFVGASGVGTAITFGAGLSQLSSSFGTALIMLTIAQVLTLAQIHVIKMAEAMFVYMLPAGVVLRSFGLTRGFGGALIAIAIGFYLAYSLSVVLMYGLMLNNVHNQVGDMPGGGGSDPDSWQSQAGGFFGWMCGLVGTIFVGAALIPFLSFIVLVSFTKGLSQSLGEEVDVSNLTRLI